MLNITSHSGIQLDCQQLGNTKFFLTPFSATGDTVDLYFRKLPSFLLWWVTYPDLVTRGKYCAIFLFMQLPPCVPFEIAAFGPDLVYHLHRLSLKELKVIPLIIFLTVTPWEPKFHVSDAYITFTVETPDIISTQHSQNKTSHFYLEILFLSNLRVSSKGPCQRPLDLNLWYFLSPPFYLLHFLYSFSH